MPVTYNGARKSQFILEHTAAGTAPDFNRIPFYACASPVAAKGRKNFEAMSCKKESD